MSFERPRSSDLSDQRPAVRRHADDESPRIQHMDGDIPPALSPLDAFAAHSRRLARELEETRGMGERRMSRLPPQHVTKSLGELKENRPLIFRKLSGEREPMPASSPVSRQNSGPTAKYDTPANRPKSSYVRLSSSLYGDGDGLGVPRSQSPTGPEISADGSANFSFGLAPPNPAFARDPYHESSEDEYASSNNGSTFSAQARRLSSSSGVSVPQSPASPFGRTHERSASGQSLSSMSTPGNKKNGPRINFSRPMSSSSLYNVVQHSRLSPTRQDSTTSHGSHVSSALQRLPTPATSFDDERSLLSDGFTGEPSSYSQLPQLPHSLPRGRQSEGASALFPDPTSPALEWKEPMSGTTSPFDGQPPCQSGRRTTSPFDGQRCQGGRRTTSPFEGRPCQSSGGHEDAAQRAGSPVGLAHRPLRRPLDDVAQRVTTSSEAPASSFSSPPTAEWPVRSRAAASTAPLAALSIPPPSANLASSTAPSVPPPPADLASSTDSQSNSTIRPTAGRAQNDYQALSADEHVTKAIDLHEHADLKESTYHLRIAAKQNHPTGMLLYALACRHGWGMRPNPAEGVQWLRKAVELSQLEVAEDENPNPTSNRRQADFVEKKAHRAQFALSVYELGQCHLNGWGMEMDKALALRCFEMAGTWGDVDALTEAGFCYAQGIGCKKDLKKAAKWYREAEKRGANTVGNSWIHKEKYSDHSDDKKNRLWKPSAPNGGKTDKSKTKGIFMRKKT
ncbi:hypothetical protein DV737_g1963, partial [Chaetothyriales sp. CBS 132003]